MTTVRTYRCDLCGDSHKPEDLTGLHFETFPARGWIAKPARQVEHHICTPCLSSLQALPRKCGQGFECDGGPNCGSDHK